MVSILGGCRLMDDEGGKMIRGGRGVKRDVMKSQDW